jgi:hypothetical protein
MRTGPLVLATAVMLALAGCVPSDSPATSAPSASPTPVFASDAEALAAAEAAYAAYLKVSDQIFIDSGKYPERLHSVATKSVYRDEAKAFRSAQEKGWRSTGGSIADNFSLESYQPGDPGHIVTVYLCSDVSNVDVLDPSGKSVVSPNRPSRTPFEVSFEYRPSAAGRLVVGDSTVWVGEGVC